jgi:hypothetical protein
MSTLTITFLFLAIALVAVPVQGVVVPCPGTDANDDCNCQQTENGVTCPAGFYCPMYSSEVISEISDAIMAENCTVRADGELQCPCTPGFYCPANTLSPSYCCESYFCETPATISICAAGDFCKVGNVAGIPCGSERDCPEGSTHSGNAGVIIAAILIFLVLFGAFSIKYFIEAKVREAQRGVLSKEKEISEGAVRRMTVVDSQSIDAMDGTKSMSVGSNNDVDKVDERKSSASLESYKISFEGVGLVLKTGVKIMNGVTGEFLPMRTCAIMGPSGAGKVSTIGCRQFLLSSH